MQGPGGIRGPSTAQAGSTIEVEVQDGSSEVEVGMIGSGATARYPVGADGKAQIPVPPNPVGSLLLVGTVGPPPPSTLSILILETE